MSEGREAAIAYFSMEVGLDPALSTYAGGLGILAGDTLRSAADLGVPMVGVTLGHRRGYFDQRLGPDGSQSEGPVAWPVEARLEALSPRAEVEIEGRPVRVRAWRYWVTGLSGFQVPVYLLDTDLPENAEADRRLTDWLYGGDPAYRLRQEAVLGLGGLRVLRALGHRSLRRFHMNEGHAALVTVGLLEERLGAAGAGPGTDVAEEVREQCVFTTHTPVPAGHDQFPMDLARRILGPRRCAWLELCDQRDTLNMTDLALRNSRYVNGVAMRHGQVSRGLFPGYPIHSITNGVHAPTWTSPPFQALFDRHLPDWRRDTLSLRYAVGIPGPDIWAAHREAKQVLVEHVNSRGGPRFDEAALTLGFARRATAYKRVTLLFHDLDRLRALADRSGPLQVVFAGKAHPADHEGKALIRRVVEAGKALEGRIAVVYLENYDMTLGRLLTAGSDVWLNTPLPPLEASGTSGMKAALNGVPSLSILDGWWIEGHVAGVTGWAIGGLEGPAPPPGADARHAASLYDQLEHAVLPCYHRDRDRFVGIMRHAIALNGAFFNTQRMMWQYLHNAYRV